jgi:DNA polymerase-3 subunit delta
MKPPPPRVLVVLGGQEFFAERTINAAVVAWQAQGAEVSEVSGGSSGVLTDLMNAASPDLFGGSPSIVLRDFQMLDEATGSAVCDMIERSTDTAWVLQHMGGRGSTKVRTRLTKLGTVVKAEPLKGRAITDFVVSEFRRHRKTADQATISLLIDAVGADPRGLASAVAQLCSDIEAEHIGRDDAAQYYSGHVEIKGYEIADAVAARDVALAVERLRFALHEGGTRAGLMTVTALTVTFQRMASAKTARGGSAAAADVATALKIPEWMARTAVNQARGWSSDQIADAIAQLAELSVLMKGGYDAASALADEQKAYVLERAVIEMATPGG